MNTLNYRIERSELVTEFEEQFGYEFAHGFGIAKGHYRRKNGLVDNHCLLADSKLEDSLIRFLIDLSNFDHCSALLDNIKSNDTGINVTVAGELIARLSELFPNEPSEGERVWIIKKRLDINSKPENVRIFVGTEEQCVEKCYQLFQEVYGSEANYTFGNVISKQDKDEHTPGYIQYTDFGKEPGKPVTYMHIRYK